MFFVWRHFTLETMKSKTATCSVSHASVSRTGRNFALYHTTNLVKHLLKSKGHREFLLGNRQKATPARHLLKQSRACSQRTWGTYWTGCCPICCLIGMFISFLTCHIRIICPYLDLNKTNVACQSIITPPSNSVRETPSRPFLDSTSNSRHDSLTLYSKNLWRKISPSRRF